MVEKQSEVDFLNDAAAPSTAKDAESSHAPEAEFPVALVLETTVESSACADAPFVCGNWNSEQKASSDSTGEYELKILSALCSFDAASFTNRNKIFSAFEEREVSVNKASKSELHMFITSRVMQMFWPNEFLDITGEADATCGKTLTGNTGRAAAARAPLAVIGRAGRPMMWNHPSAGPAVTRQFKSLHMRQNIARLWVSCMLL